MNNLECLLITKKVLKKLFNPENVKKVSSHISRNNKIYFDVLLDDEKFSGFIYYHNKLVAKDIKNILFAFKRNALKSLERGTDVNTRREDVCPEVDKH